MVVNEAWAELMGFSSTKANVMTIVAYTGAEINSLTGTDGQIVYCYTSGSGYIRGHWYGWDSVKSDWIDLVALPKTYDFFGALDGSADYAHFGMVIDRRSATREMYTWDLSGTGASVTNSVTDNSDGVINLETGTTSTGWSALYANGPKGDWGQKMLLKVKFKTSSGAVTGQINKLGVNIDRAGLGPSNRRNFGIEWCDGDSSFQIHSGNGTSQSNFDTEITVTTDSTWEADMYFDPGNEVKVIFDDGTTVTEKVKTTFIPSSGQTTEDGLMKFSISNNAGNTTNRLLKIRAAYLVYGTNDEWWT